MDDAIFDYIVVGAGSAGAVLANRLSADPATRVLLLEAGGPANNPMLNMPVGFYKCLGNSAYDWCYRSEPDSSINGRRIRYNAGKIHGGSSSINGMMFIRGQRDDFDGWRDMGCEGWGFDDVLPAFRMMETNLAPPRPSQGTDGPQYVSLPREPAPLTEDFIAACGALGAKRLDDYGGGDQEGAFLALTSTRNGRRWSTADGYLKPILGRRNLTVVNRAEVDRVLHADGLATGVRYLAGGKAFEAAARREVILSAGAMNSPAILMRSGIGPGDVLNAAGIAVRRDLPGVGRNLHDHPTMMLSRKVDVPTINTRAGPFSVATGLLRYLAARRGMMTSVVIYAMAMFRSREGLPAPDILLSYVPMAMDRSTSIPGMLKVPGVSISVLITRPRARGQVRVRNDDPFAPPTIDYGLLSDEGDLRDMIAGARIAERVFDAMPLAAHVLGRNDPPVTLAADDAWEQFARNRADGSWHPVGTCRMGVDAMAVVDPRLRVRGIARLRVADASVMPRITSGNTNAPTIMIGEKAAGMILEDN